MDRINQVWPEWRTEALLGEGSFGKVYKVKREVLGNVTYSAVKHIQIPQQPSEIRDLQNSGMDDASVHVYFEDMVKNLLNEIQIMESMKSASHIVGIEDYYVEELQDTVGWEIFIRMELLTDLGTYLNGRQLTEDQVVRLGIDIADALIDCERVHIIHRDIKINNVFVSQFGAFKLGDFGISKQLEKTQSALSQKGTNMYMAPEVFRGERYDKTVDIYSLGIMLYRLLNQGRFPFLPPAPAVISYSDTQNAMMRRIGGEAVPPVPGINPALSAIVTKACSSRPGDRYPSALAMKQALFDYQRSKQQEASAQPQTAAQTQAAPQAQTQTAPQVQYTFQGQAYAGQQETEPQTVIQKAAAVTSESRDMIEEMTSKTAGVWTGSNGTGSYAGTGGYTGQGSTAGQPVSQGYAGAGGYAGQGSYAGTGGYTGQRSTASQSSFQSDTGISSHAGTARHTSSVSRQQELSGKRSFWDNWDKQKVIIAAAALAAVISLIGVLVFQYLRLNNPAFMSAEKLDDYVRYKGTFHMGACPQKNNGKDSMIEWEILDQDEMGMLVVSRYMLTFTIYDEGEGITSSWSWDNSVIKQELDRYVDIYFTPEEKNYIEEREIFANVNGQDRDSSPSKLFLLSYPEVSQYGCQVTGYTQEAETLLPDKPESKNGHYCSSYWWTRSVFTSNQNYEGEKSGVMAVGLNGESDCVMHPNTSQENGLQLFGVRPAMWVDYNQMLSSGILKENEGSPRADFYER